MRAGYCLALQVALSKPATWVDLCRLMICLFFVFVCCTLDCPSGEFSHEKFGSLSPRKVSCNRVALPTLINYDMHAGSFRVSINVPNYDMDYRIFYVHTWSFACERIHTGVGHTDSESAQHFDSKKLTLFLVRLTGFEPRVFGSRVPRSTNWATQLPLIWPLV